MCVAAQSAIDVASKSAYMATPRRGNGKHIAAGINNVAGK
jgi:hypothetical protein